MRCLETSHETAWISQNSNFGAMVGKILQLLVDTQMRILKTGYGKKSMDLAHAEIPFGFVENIRDMESPM